MKRILLILALALLFLPLHSQVKDRYDLALDQYEAICVRCLELRHAMDNGEAVKGAEISALLEQLSDLKQTLSEGDGQMSEEQRRRFEAIKGRFLAYGEPEQAFPEIIAPSVSYSQTEMPFFSASASTSPKSSAFVLAVGGISAYPDIGLMGGLGYGRWGGYVSLRARPVPLGYDYTCDSSGQAAYGQVWTSGKEFHTKWQITAGASYDFTRHWHAFAGCGYSSACLLWEDIDGKRALVTDLSRMGFCAEAGALFFYSHIAVGAGLSTTGPFVAAGYRF